MSDIMEPGFNLKSAQRYNERAADKVGWDGHIPQAAIDAHPDLKKDPGSEAFAQAVFDLQQSLGFSGPSLDGKLGRGTWSKILKKYDYVDKDSRYVMHNGRRLAIEDTGQSYSMINYDQPGGFDLHQDGGFSRRKSGDIRLIVIHWGGISVKSLHRALRSRNLSSHFGIEKDKVYQLLDTKHKAWHAGYPNDFSIGIDICQQPTTKWLDHFLDEGYDVEVMDNPTDRGDEKILTLNPEARKATKELVQDLCALFDIPFKVPRGMDGLADSGPLFHGVIDKEAIKDGKFTGVVGHHHTRKTKWDIAPWWEAIFG